MQIERTRGDTVPDVVTVTSAKNRKVVNITGFQFKMTVDERLAPDDISTQLYQLDGVISDAEAGVVEFFPTEEQANRVGYFYYDIQMTDSYGKVCTPLSGQYVYVQDITK